MFDDIHRREIKKEGSTMTNIPLRVHNVLPKYKTKEERNQKLQQAYLSSVRQIYHMKNNSRLSLKIK